MNLFAYYMIVIHFYCFISIFTTAASGIINISWIKISRTLAI